MIYDPTESYFDPKPATIPRVSRVLGIVMWDGKGCGSYWDWSVCFKRDGMGLFGMGGEMKKENVVQEKSMPVLAVVKPSEPSHCFIAAEKRAEHWLGVWERFWSPKRGWQ